MNKDIEQYVAYCRLFIGDTASATDEQIDAAINHFAFMFPKVEGLEVKKRLLSLYTLPIGPF